MMSMGGIAVLERKLDETVAQLKQSTDPDIRRRLLAEMRLLIARLDNLVLESAKSYKARPE